MIEVDWSVCQKLKLSANTIFVQETDDAWHIRFHANLDDIYCKKEKSVVDFENQNFIISFLQKPNVFKVISVGVIEQEVEDDSVEMFVDLEDDEVSEL